MSTRDRWLAWRLRRMVQARGGSAVVACNLESTRAAIRLLELEGYHVAYRDRDATITAPPPARAAW